jgi:acyl-CoA thioesterase-1
VLAAAATRAGTLVDLHGWFLRGDPSWFTRTIEPSLRGASEIRRAFWPRVSRLQPATAGGGGE